MRSAQEEVAHRVQWPIQEKHATNIMIKFPTVRLKNAV